MEVFFMKFKPIHYILIVLAALLVIGGLTVAVILSMNKEPEPCLHPNLGAYEHSDMQHWKVCPDCQEQIELAEHAYVENVCICGLDETLLPRYELAKCSKMDYGIFAADVVANALLHHLKQYEAQNGVALLNSAQAVSNFPISSKIQSVTDGRDATDVFYNNTSD
jgi:hypothetical protein